MKPVVNASGPSVPAEPRMLGAWDLFIGVFFNFLPLRAWCCQGCRSSAVSWAPWGGWKALGTASVQGALLFGDF